MRRRLTILLTSSAILSGLLPAAVGAASAPLPASMVAVGDSISQAASTGGGLGTDYPQNAWSTGTNSTVNSHYLRLLAAGAPINGAADNLSVSGAKVLDLDEQMHAAVPLQPDYLTVLIGGNDLCTDTVAGMTSTTAFESALRTAMDTITQESAETRVYVVSIPDVYQLWNLFKGNWWPRTVWSLGDICQSLLANPTSTQQADVQRRAEVRARNQAFNAILADVCDDYAQCHHDGGRVFAYQFSRSDVSADYFHPSISGQANLARETWLAGYTWTTSPPANVDPTASFSFGCTDLACSFADTSTDDGSVVAWQWTFGDGTGGSVQNPSHTYGSAGSYAVTLTVTDDEGGTDSISQSVTVTAAEPPPEPDGTMSVAGLEGSATSGKGQAWTASVTIRIVDDGGASLSGATVSGSWSTGGSSTCITSNGSCTVTVSVNARKATSTTFSVTDVVLAGYTYDPSAGSSLTIDRP